MGTPNLLSLNDVNVHFGASHILHGVSLAMGAEPVSMVGRNGMGKTTLCQAIMGLVPVSEGTIRLGETDLTNRRAFKIARSGIGYVPQGRRVFPSLSVEEHLALVAQGRGARRRGEGEWTIEAIYETFPRLAERRRNGGTMLSGGEQQMLAVARALLLNPRLLIMDEPTEGLAPVIVDQLVNTLRAIGRSGVGLLLVEQNFAVATAVSPRCLVMMNGAIALDTTSERLAADDDLQRRYLGVGTGAEEATDGEDREAEA